MRRPENATENPEIPDGTRSTEGNEGARAGGFHKREQRQQREKRSVKRPLALVLGSRAMPRHNGSQCNCGGQVCSQVQSGNEEVALPPLRERGPQAVHGTGCERSGHSGRGHQVRIGQRPCHGESYDEFMLNAGADYLRSRMVVKEWNISLVAHEQGMSRNRLKRLLAAHQVKIRDESGTAPPPNK